MPISQGGGMILQKSFISLDNLALFREELVADWTTSTKRTWSSSKISDAVNRITLLEILTGTSSDYLNFSANLPDTVVRLMNAVGYGSELDIEYSFDRINWEQYTIGDDITIPTNGKVYFRGDNDTLCTYNMLEEMYDYHFFEFKNESLSTLEVEAHGNVNSLLSKIDFDQMREFTSRNNILGHSTIRDNDMGGGLLQSSENSLRGRDLDDLGDGDNLSGGIQISQRPTYIFSALFRDCTALTTAPYLPATKLAEACYDHMFVNCTSLTTAPILPATELVEDCYNSMFMNCTSLNSVTCLATDISAARCTADWLDNVAATGTFYKDVNMSDWTTGTSGIPLGWTTQTAPNIIIQEYINNNVEIYDIATNAEIDLLFVPVIIQPNDEIWYTSQINVVTPNDTTGLPTIISNTYNDGKGVIKFATDLTSIEDGYSQFEGCEFTSISLPNNLTNIPYGFLQTCDYLESVSLPNNLTAIDMNAFAFCSRLTSIDIPEGVEYIGESAFQECYALTSVTLHNGLSSIGSSAFNQCSFASITIPSTVTYIGSAFNNCDNLTSITCEATTPPELEGDFEYVANLAHIYVPAESVNTYKAATIWSDYASIIEAIQ